MLIEEETARKGRGIRGRVTIELVDLVDFGAPLSSQVEFRFTTCFLPVGLCGMADLGIEAAVLWWERMREHARCRYRADTRLTGGH
jgi:hypothetical protein